MQVGSINFGGLASGIDTKALIDAIMNVERRPMQRLEDRQSNLNSRKTALDQMRSKLNAFLTSLRDLSSSRVLRGKTVSVSNETVLSASVGSAAALGTYSIDVLQLATSNKVASNGVADSGAGGVGAGRLTIQSGDNDAIDIEVSAADGNDSLTAIRDAINSADAGVSASILHDGSAYRLVVAADETGSANALSISDSTGLGLDDPGNEVQAAADAELTVDGIAVTSTSNQVSGVLEGVTFDLLATTAGSPVTLQVGNNVEGTVEAVQSMVESYNEAIGFLNSQLDLDDPGPLANDSYARRMQQQLQSLVTAGINGVAFGGIRSFSSMGIDFDGRSAELSVDGAELRNILEERFDEVADLFLSTSSTSDPRIQFLGGGSAVAGEYAVEITQAAEQATLVGSAPIRVDGLRRDEDLTITVNGETVTANLLARQTIDEVVDVINAALSGGGLATTASNEGGALRITSDEYGADQSLTVESSRNSSDGRQTGFSRTPATDLGEHVAGRIGGSDAVGAGRTLTAPDEGDVAGLSLLVTATQFDVADTGGDFGFVSFSFGLAKPLIDQLSEATRLGDGRIADAKDSLDDQLRRISDDIQRLEERLVGREALLVRTFAEAERAIASLQSQQGQLGSFISF